MAAASPGQVPRLLEESLRGRDVSALPDNALVRFQSIGLAPGISRNFRFVLLQDGGLLLAENTAAEPVDPVQRFNAALPDSPSMTVRGPTVDRIRGLLREGEFASSPSYVGDEAVRDGSVMIVTSRVGGALKEVWYHNCDTELTDLLWSLRQSAHDDEVDLDALLAELPTLPDDTA
jgi:hypothetical protein